MIRATSHVIPLIKCEKFCHGLDRDVPYKSCTCTFAKWIKVEIKMFSHLMEQLRTARHRIALELSRAGLRHMKLNRAELNHVGAAGIVC